MNISEGKILETHLNPLTFQLKKKLCFLMMIFGLPLILIYGQTQLK